MPDAPFGHVHWLTMSFLTPQKLEHTKYLDVIGFKIHNGYGAEEIADSDAKKIKDGNKRHDVFPLELGKLYPWDDISKAEELAYDDDRMNDLEQKRRENADKLKLMREQFKNENYNFPVNPNDKRKTETADRLRNDLYKKGKITKKEYEMMQERNKPLSEIKHEAAERERLDTEAVEAYATDYLDINEEVPLKYGCISIFTPKTIHNLKEPCFKIRGLFQTVEDLDDRIAQLQKLSPDDRIHKFEVGRWYVYSDADLEGDVLLRQLNYAMKCHLDLLDKEAAEFADRKDKLKSEAEAKAKGQNISNKKERRKEKRDERKKRKEEREKAANQPVGSAEPNAQSAPTPTKDDYVKTVHSLREGVDNESILNLMEYLNDDELLGKFVSNEPVDRSNAAVLEL